MASRRERIRRLLAERGRMSIVDMAKELEIDRKAVNQSVQAMYGKEQLERVGKGQYRLITKSKRARMWKIVRARKNNITAEILAELTDSCQQYCQDYLRSLVAQDIMVRNRRGDNTWVYRLKHDIGPIAPNQSIAEVDRALEWKKVQEAKVVAEQAMRNLMKLMEAYDAKWGEQPDGDAAA